MESEAQLLLQRLEKKLLKLKPKDPIPFIYAYFQSVSEGEIKP